jgi:hypothetical protein
MAMVVVVEMLKVVLKDDVKEVELVVLGNTSSINTGI